MRGNTILGTHLVKSYSSGQVVLIWSSRTHLVKSYSSGHVVLIWSSRTHLVKSYSSGQVVQSCNLHLSARSMTTSISEALKRNVKVVLLFNTAGRDLLQHVT